MKKVIAVFDIGKTNKKILLFDQNFKMVFQHEEKMTTISDDDGFECDDINLITNWMIHKLSGIVSKGEYDLVAVNFSTYGASLMFLNTEAKPLTPVYNYLKEISPEISETLFEQYGGKDEFCRKTASPALGLMLNSGIQILWLQQEKPEIAKKVKSILHFPQYLSFVLSKQVVSEPTSIGCHTFLWDFDNMEYHQWIEDKNISLPKPITNDIIFPAKIAKKNIKVGTGIHDSSAALVPYLKKSKAKFILISTGTWCINMNPFNNEALTAYQLAQDCLCFLSPDKKQVKSSRLFMGHFHEMWAEKLAKHFRTKAGYFKTVKNDNMLINKLIEKYGNKQVFFPNGKESFNADLELVALSSFNCYEEAYSKLIIDLTVLCASSVKLTIPENDATSTIYISGGFARNEIFINQISKHFIDKDIYTSEIDNGSALGAALVLGNSLEDFNDSDLELGLKKC